MADLADDGYLSQPHTSAGRIPTDKAFRSFAGAVSARPLSSADRDRIFNQMQAANRSKTELASRRACSRRSPGMWVSPPLCPPHRRKLEHLELVHSRIAVS